MAMAIDRSQHNQYVCRVLYTSFRRTAIAEIVASVMGYYRISFAQVATQALQVKAKGRAALERDLFNLLYRFADPFAEWIASPQAPLETQQMTVCRRLIQEIDIQGATPEFLEIRDSAFFILGELEKVSARAFLKVWLSLSHLKIVKALLVAANTFGESSLELIKTKDYQKQWDLPYLRKYVFDPLSGAEKIPLTVHNAEAFIFLVHYLVAIKKLRQASSVLQLRNLETEFLQLKSTMEQLFKTPFYAKKLRDRTAIINCLHRLHKYLRYQIFHLKQSQWIEVLRSKDSARIDESWQAYLDSPLLQKLCPKQPQIQKIVKFWIDRPALFKTTFLTEESLSFFENHMTPLNVFRKNMIVRQFAYSFMYTILQTQSRERCNILSSTSSIFTPEEFANLDKTPKVHEGFLSLEELAKLYAEDLPILPTPPRPQQSPVTKPHTSFNTQAYQPGALMQKKKKKGDDLAHLANEPVPVPQGGKVDLPPQHKAAPAEARRMIPFPKIKQAQPLLYAQRVQERLAAARPQAANKREDAWAHGFTLQLDQLIDTSYCHSVKKSHPNTGKMETHHGFVVMVEDDEDADKAATPYIATYTVDEQGVCYHRCLQKKSRDQLFDAFANDQVTNLIDYPPLILSAAAQGAKAVVVVESEQTPIMLDPVFKILIIKDLKHKITLKVLPQVK